MDAQHQDEIIKDLRAQIDLLEKDIKKKDDDIELLRSDNKKLINDLGTRSKIFGALDNRYDEKLKKIKNNLNEHFDILNKILNEKRSDYENQLKKLLGEKNDTSKDLKSDIDKDLDEKQKESISEYNNWFLSEIKKLDINVIKAFNEYELLLRVKLNKIANIINESEEPAKIINEIKDNRNIANGIQNSITNFPKEIFKYFNDKKKNKHDYEPYRPPFSIFWISKKEGEMWIKGKRNWRTILGMPMVILGFIIIVFFIIKGCR